MKNLVYKGIVFDDWCQYDTGEKGRTCLTHWAEICESCARKYRDKIKSRIDDGKCASGICGVKGCNNHGVDADIHYYIDFEGKEITFEEENG